MAARPGWWWAIAAQHCAGDRTRRQCTRPAPRGPPPWSGLGLGLGLGLGSLEERHLARSRLVREASVPKLAEGPETPRVTASLRIDGARITALTTDHSPARRWRTCAAGRTTRRRAAPRRRGHSM
eukprot:scaffold41438_cov53-Phaeocystis_antarctica.AAC.1